MSYLIKVEPPRILDLFKTGGISQDQAMNILGACVKNKIERVRVNYD